MPTTANKGYSVQAAGTNAGTWGAGSSDALNEGVIELLDDDMGGLNSTALSSSNVTLTAAQGRHLIQRLTGTLSADILITSPNVGFNIYENATTGDFAVTVQFTAGAGADVVIPQGARALVIADATNGLRFATSALAGEALVLRRPNDTSEYEVLSLQSGNGSGDTGSDRIVGDGSDGVAERRRYIGSTEIERLTAALDLINIIFGVGASLRVDPDGHFDFTEVSAPSNPSANIASLFAFDDGGVTTLRYLRSDGSDVRLRAATQTEMEAGSAVNVITTPGRQHFHPGHPKAGGKFDGSAGTPAFASGDYGMGAITDIATGDWTLAFDTAFADTNYWMAGWARHHASAGSGAMIVSAEANDVKTASEITIITRGDGGTGADSPEVNVTFWGDYA